MVLNKSYQEMAEHYGTAILPTQPRSPKDKAFLEGSVGVVSTWILAAPCTTPAAAMHHSSGGHAPSSVVKLHFWGGVCTKQSIVLDL